jgi:predicted O-methyltransferase YrrM
MFKPRYSILDLLIFCAVVSLVCLFNLRTLLEQRNSLIANSYQSPLAVVKVAEEAMPDPSQPIYRAPYEFTQDWFGWNLPVWKSVLGPLAGRANLRYLEVGLYEGRSALWMLENVLTDPTSHLTGIDLFEGELKERFFENLRKSGLSERAIIVSKPSQIAMRELPLESFDIIYIDGSHATADVLEDALLAYRLLKPEGILIFDDYRWSGARYRGPLTRDESSDFPKKAIDAFVLIFTDRFEVLHNSYQLILKKQISAP